MGLLADIYSYGDGLKRKVNGLLADPSGTLEQMVGRLKDDQNAMLNLQANAYPMAGDKTVLNSPAQIAGFRRQLADKGADMAMSAATVWHGSPHKFDKFDSSKIGTGEGAQAYGHGLYLAESPDVAKSYQTTLTMDRGFNFGGKSGLTREQLQDLVNAREGGKYLDGVTKPSGVADQVIDSIVYGKNGELPRGYKSGSERAALFEKLKREIAHTDEGALYKVDLPDEHIAKMLDWDKPLSKQPASKESIDKLLSLAGRNSEVGWDAPSNTFPSDLLSLMSRKLGGQDKVAEAMRQQSIPGIRYLDGGSRGAGAGSSNYVVFPGNEGLLSILERNGQAIK